MHSHLPPDRREFEIPEHGATAPPTGRRVSTARSTALAMLVAVLVLAAVIAVIVLL